MLRVGLGLAAVGAFARAAGFGRSSENGSENGVGAVSYNAELALIKDLSPDVRFFRFQLPDPRELFFMPVTSTLEVNTKQETSRQYTPVNPNGTLGYFDIVAKRLPGGMVTDGFLWKLRVGDQVYSTLRTLPLRYKPNTYKNIGMISAGVGLTPLLQLAREVLTNPYDDTKIWLLSVNRTENDIILREDLDRLQRDYPDRFRVTHLLSMPSPSWSGFRGEVTESVVRTAMPVDPRDVQRNIVLVSGPDSFCTHVAGTIPDPAMSNPGQRRQGARPTLLKGRLTCGFQPGEVFVF